MRKRLIRLTSCEQTAFPRERRVATRHWKCIVQECHMQDGHLIGYDRGDGTAIVSHTYQGTDCITVDPDEWVDKTSGLKRAMRGILACPCDDDSPCEPCRMAINNMFAPEKP